MHVEKQHTSSKLDNKGSETITSDPSFTLNTFMAIIKMEMQIFYSRILPDVYNETLYETKTIVQFLGTQTWILDPGFC